MRLPWAMLAVAAVAAAAPLEAPQPVPDVVDGFSILPVGLGAAFSTLKPDAPLLTALAFGPDDDLYATTTFGDVLRFPLAWTAGGPISAPPVVRASGFTLALGMAFVGDALFVSDHHPGLENDRVDGRVTRLLPGQVAQTDGLVVVEGLPNGLHNTNHLRLGPDGRLWIANGNANDDGVNGGVPDVPPYSGALLSVDPAGVAASPAVLHWKDEAGQAIPLGLIAGHARNADFVAKVRVEARGLRNAFGVAFSPAGVAYTAVNGPDLVPAQDWLVRVAPGADYGFPRCIDEGEPGAVGDGIRVVPSLLFPASQCGAVPAATALLGWHTCPTGLDLPRGDGAAAFPQDFQGALYVAECGSINARNIAFAALQHPSTHNVGHKVARVLLAPDGEAVEVRDFVTGLAEPTDALFGPDGALYVADVLTVYRVAPLPR